MSHVLIGKQAGNAASWRVEFKETIQRSTVDDKTTPDTYLAPGFIDIQINGFGGVDYNDPVVTNDDIARSIQTILTTGVTRCYPTVITGEPSQMVRVLTNLRRASGQVPFGEVFDGFHVEGPHISPDDGPRGAHPREWVRAPDLDEFKRWQDAAGGRVRIVTVAPEWPDALEYIEALAAMNVVVAIGHTAATAARIADAVSAGATLSTHLGNGTARDLARHPNLLWDQLADDRLSASFIADGIHVPASFLKVALRAKGIGRSVLVTDASAPAGCRPGRYTLGALTIDLTADERIVLAGRDRLAGSSLRMDRAVSNAIALCGVPLDEAIAMATTTAARVGRVSLRANGLATGDRADFVVFKIDPDDGALQVVETYVSGACGYRATGRA